MKILIVEDEFSSRVILQKLLSHYGETHIAVNGKEALEVFENALGSGEPYDLICLDIMMPGMDGLEVLQKIRSVEAGQGIIVPDAVKIIMITSVKDPKNVMQAFNSQCEAYLIKPIDRSKLVDHLQQFGFLK